MDKDLVKKLSSLSRIEIEDQEAEDLAGELGQVLAYVGEIKSVGGEASSRDKSPNRNVMREDSEGHESGIYTESVLGEAPLTEDGYIKVKKIL